MVMALAASPGEARFCQPNLFRLRGRLSVTCVERHLRRCLIPVVYILPQHIDDLLGT